MRLTKLTVRAPRHRIGIELRRQAAARADEVGVSDAERALLSKIGAAGATIAGAAAAGAQVVVDACIHPDPVHQDSWSASVLVDVTARPGIAKRREAR